MEEVLLLLINLLFLQQRLYCRTNSHHYRKDVHSKSWETLPQAVHSTRRVVGQLGVPCGCSEHIHVEQLLRVKMEVATVISCRACRMR